ncbi:MAG TPA: BMP family ABC transporter substrate-binding protein [Flexilinea sp.]|nr:BMP family ABC transporter substrate-binding protein [Flexilinea sp.]HQP45713.1 BMP family ABC transporter substrate-binding protein [Flexilinea sp.]
MKKKLWVFVSLVLIAMFAMTGAVSASDLKIGIVCSAAGQNDNGYNQSAIEGAKQVSEELGIDYKVIDATSDVPAALETLAEDGYNLIFSLEYDFEALIKGVGGNKPIAEQYPDTTFVVFNDNPNIDENGNVIHKNVISVLFDVHEASFVAGALSVLVNENNAVLFGEGYHFTDPAKTRAIGFIGGTNSNGITVFSYGFIQGINYVAQQLGVKYDYYAKYDAGFSDPATGSTVAGTYYDNGANVVFGCAGNVGDGITSKAKEVGKLAIQVDANKDNQQPGYVLTSVLKNTKVPVYTISKALKDGTLSSMGNLQTYSLSSGATGITDLSVIGEHIQKTDAAAAKWAEIKQQVSDISAKIGSDIKVVNAAIGEKFDPASCPNVVIK